MKKRIFFAVLLVMVAAFASEHLAYSEEDTAVGVAGCGAVQVNPSSSLEFQQSICHEAEENAASSCAASGHGVCSSPKLNNTLPDGTHCICISPASDDESVDSEEVLV